MTQLRWLAPSGVFDGGLVQKSMFVGVDGHGIVQVVTDQSPSASVVKIEGILSPGFIDLQVNGGGGVLLNDAPTVEAICEIRNAHLKSGTAWILPTVITDAPEVLIAAVDAVLKAHEQDGILGIHIEGPHISPQRRGTHALEFVRPMDETTLEQVKKLRSAGVTVMITLAPEVVSMGDIKVLSDLGAIVSIGHTAADAKLCQEAISNGAMAVTHLWNAMAPIYNRDPGPVGAALDAGVYCGLICDGYHVDDMLLRLTLRGASDPDALFIVSDAMPTVEGPETFVLYGQGVHLKDGRLINSEGSLAGAHITQACGVARLVGELGLSLEQALRMAIATPARIVGRCDLSNLKGQMIENLILVDQSGQSVTKPMV